jgi:tRNA(Ile)-lysidine synthase
MKRKEEALARLADVVRDGGLVDAHSSGVVMISGGADSACAAAGLARALGAGNVHALHVNYGLRPAADEDERSARALCGTLRIDLHVERPTLPEGNVQAAARRARYDAAERLRARTGSDWVATGHTRTDLAETVLYRLAASPGTRALRGLPARSGRVVRPLLALGREEVRELATAAALPFRDDESNEEPIFARNRIRGEVLPVLAELSRAVEQNISETQAELVEEAELLERLVLDALGAAGAGAASVAIGAGELQALDPGLRRLGLRALAERAAGRAVALGRDRATQIAELALRPEGGIVELGGGVRAVCEGGLVRFEVASPADAAPVPAAAALKVPGTCRLGGWEVRAELHPVPVEPTGPDVATLDAARLGGELEVRTWREGDRIRPLGLGGSKTLQDLFTDGRVPRSQRHDVPVVLASGQIAWVAGLAVADDFKLSDQTENVVVLSARRAIRG